MPNLPNQVCYLHIMANGHLVMQHMNMFHKICISVYLSIMVHTDVVCEWSGHVVCSKHVNVRLRTVQLSTSDIFSQTFYYLEVMCEYGRK